MGRLKALSGHINHDVLLVIAATILSIARTGYIFPYFNNQFHLPVVQDLYDHPNFASSAFIQSMRYYSSGFWWTLSGIWDGRNGDQVFFALFVASRALFFAACLPWAGILGLAGLPQKAAFLALLAFCPLLTGYSYAGSGGLLIEYFSHSELANATLLLSIALAARSRFAAAVGVNGLTFFLNAFMGVWGFVPILGCAAYHLLAGPEKPGAIRRGMLIGAPVFALLSAPVVWMIISNPDFGRSIDFDYPSYLRFYYPDHFLITEAPPRQLLGLALMSLVGLMAAGALIPRDRRAVFAAIGLLSFILLWIAGAALPAFTSSPLLLNLHLLRASAGIHLMAALALVALLVSWLAGASERQRSWAPVLAIAIATARFATPMALLAIPLSFLFALPRSILRIRVDLVVGLLLVVLAWPGQIWGRHQAQAGIEAEAGEWRAIASWARQNTEGNAVFLVPIDPNAPFANGSVVFEAYSERRMWVDFRSGAAVMWMPSFHQLWHRRVNEVMNLGDWTARMQYARTEGIDYVIDACGDRPLAAFRSGRTCVYAAAE